MLRRLQDELAGRFGELRVVPALVDGGRPVQLAQVREAAGRLDGSLSRGGKVRVLQMGEASAEFFRQATILQQAAGAPP